LLIFLSFPAFAAPGDTLFITETGDTVTKAQLDSLQKIEAVEKLPELKEFIKAEYPARELKSGVEGSVLLELFVSDSGRVDSARVSKSLVPAMDTAALRAVKRFRFTPALAGNKPVPVIVQYQYVFSIRDEVKAIEQYVNLKGLLREKGTRSPVKDGMVVAVFPDTASDTAIKIPWSAYLSKIGSFTGQYVESGKLVTSTDSLGNFIFQSLPAGPVLLTFPIAGYRADRVPEIIERGKSKEVEYRLEKLNYNEYEIVVYGKIEKQEVAKSTLTLSEVKRIPGFGGDAVKVVQALPGVARASFISGDVIVRGSGNGDTRYFLDGVQIPLLFHFGGLRSTYNSDALSSIDLYPGGFNARYGSAIGGIVEIKGRPAKTDRWHGNVDINMIDASFLTEGPVTSKLSLMVTARRSYIANVAAFIIKQMGIYLPMTVVPYYWDAVARLDYRPAKGDHMFLTAFLIEDKMEFITQRVRGGSTEVSSAKNTLSADITAQMLLYGWDRDISDRLKNELRFSLNRGTTDFNFFSFARANMTSNGPYVRDQLSYQWTDHVTLNAGLDMKADSIDYRLNMLSAQGAVRSGGRNLFSDLGGYTLADIRPVKTLSIMPGLRYDYYTEVSDGGPSLRLTARYQYRPGHALKGALGTYNQSPIYSTNQSAAYSSVGQAIDSVWGNPDLPITKARQAVLGYEYQITDLISLDAQAYYNRQYQIPMNGGDSISLKTGKNINFLPDQEGRMYGLELMLRHNQGEHFFGWISYSLSRSERRSPRPDNPDMGGGSSSNLVRAWDPKAWHIFGKDQTHNLQLVGSWRLSRGWETGLRVRYVTGNPETPQLGYTSGRYEYDAESGRYVDLFGTVNSDRMGPFFQIDARVDKKFVYRSWIFSLYLDVQNVNYFLYNSPETYDYNYDSSERQTIGGIIIPSLGIRAEF
jgi:TonB family protein